MTSYVDGMEIQWTYCITEEQLARCLNAEIASRLTLANVEGMPDVMTFGDAIIEEIKWHLAWRGEVLWDVVRRPYVLAYNRSRGVFRAQMTRRQMWKAWNVLVTYGIAQNAGE